MSGPAASAVVAADEVANCCFIIKSGPERIDDPTIYILYCYVLQYSIPASAPGTVYTVPGSATVTGTVQYGVLYVSYISYGPTFS